MFKIMLDLLRCYPKAKLRRADFMSHFPASYLLQLADRRWWISGFALMPVLPGDRKAIACVD